MQLNAGALSLQHAEQKAQCCTSRPWRTRYVSMDGGGEKAGERRELPGRADPTAPPGNNNVPHLRHDPLSAPGEGGSNDTGTIALELKKETYSGLRTS